MLQLIVRLDEYLHYFLKETLITFQLRDSGEIVPMAADWLARGEDGSGAETYIDMLRYNVDTIATALGE